MPGDGRTCAVTERPPENAEVVAADFGFFFSRVSRSRDASFHLLPLVSNFQLLCLPDWTRLKAVPVLLYTSSPESLVFAC